MKKKQKNKAKIKTEMDFSVQNNGLKQETSRELYTIIEQEDFLDDNNNPRVNSENDKRIMAKKIKNHNKIKYLIKLDNSGKFYNPMSPISSIRPTKILQTISLTEDRFKEVNEISFNMYLNFLRSKNTSWINNAERESF